MDHPTIFLILALVLPLLSLTIPHCPGQLDEGRKLQSDFWKKSEKPVSGNTCRIPLNLLSIKNRTEAK
jgi:hypothetical protein